VSVIVFALVVRFAPPARIIPRDLLPVVGSLAAAAIGSLLRQGRSHLSDSGEAGADIDAAGARKPPMFDTLGRSGCRQLSHFAHPARARVSPIERHLWSCAPAARVSCEDVRHAVASLAR